MIHFDKNFKKGFMIGSLVGGILVAAGMSNKGKELRENVTKYVEELFKELKKKTHEWSEATQENYNEMVRRAVEEFSRQKGLVFEMKELITRKLENKWEEIQSEILFCKAKKRFMNEEQKSEESYEKIVHALVDEYESRKNISGYVKYRLVKDLKHRFNELKAEVQTTLTQGWL